MANLQTIPLEAPVIQPPVIRTFPVPDDADVLIAIKEHVAFWQPWLETVKDSYDMRMMKSADPVGGEFITPDVRVGFNLAKHMLSRRKSLYAIPRSTEQDEAQHRINSDTERLLEHVWEANDFKLRLQGRESFDRQIADWAIGTGMIDVLWYVSQDVDGFPIFVADPLDPTQTFPEFGSIEDGLLAVDRVFQQSSKSLEREGVRKGWDLSKVNFKQNQKFMTVKDHWEQEKFPDDKYAVYHAIFIEDKKVWGEFEDLPEGIPIVSIPTGGMQTASNYFTNPADAAAHWGENILVPSQMVYRMRNMSWQLNMQDLVDQVQKTIVDQTMGRRGVMTADDFGKIVHLDLNESVHEIAKQAYTSQFQSAHAGLDQMQQRALFPWTMFGQTPFDLSGVALEQLNSAAITVIGPAQESIEFAKTVISLGWLAEFKRRWGGTGVTLRVSGVFENKTRTLVLSPEDVPERPNLRITKPIDLAADQITKANIARLLRPQGDLADYEYIADKVLELQDPDLMRERIHDDSVYQDPAVQAALALEALDKMAEARAQEGDARGEAILRSAFERLNAQFEETAAQGNAPPPQPGVFPQVQPDLAQQRPLERPQ